MKLKDLIAGVMTACLFFTAINVSLAKENGYVPKPVYNDKGEIIGTTRKASANADIFDSAEADITGDGIVDIIYLTGSQFESSPFTSDIQIVVKNGATGLTITGGMDKFSGYSPKLFVGDFNGDKIADVYVEAASGGSGGWYHHEIVSFAGAEPNIIFDDQHNRGSVVTGKFIDGYKVELTFNHKLFLLDVHDRKTDYLRLSLYDKNGRIKKETKIMVSPYGKMVPVDIENDGTYELQGSQRISGAYNADGLATVESILKYKGTDSWSPQLIKLNITLLDERDSLK